MSKTPPHTKTAPSGKVKEFSAATSAEFSVEEAATTLAGAQALFAEAQAQQVAKHADDASAANKSECSEEIATFYMQIKFVQSYLSVLTGQDGPLAEGRPTRHAQCEYSMVSTSSDKSQGTGGGSQSIAGCSHDGRKRKLIAAGEELR